MFIYVAAITAASALVYLGSLSVWVAVLALTVKALFAIIAIGILGGIGYVAWWQYGKLITNRSSAE